MRDRAEITPATHHFSPANSGTTRSTTEYKTVAHKFIMNSLGPLLPNSSRAVGVGCGPLEDSGEVRHFPANALPRPPSSLLHLRTSASSWHSLFLASGEVPGDVLPAHVESARRLARSCAALLARCRLLRSRSHQRPSERDPPSRGMERQVSIRSCCRHLSPSFMARAVGKLDSVFSEVMPESPCVSPRRVPAFCWTGAAGCQGIAMIWRPSWKNDNPTMLG